MSALIKDVERLRTRIIKNKFKLNELNVPLIIMKKLNRSWGEALRNFNHKQNKHRSLTLSRCKSVNYIPGSARAWKPFVHNTRSHFLSKFCYQIGDWMCFKGKTRSHPLMMSLTEKLKTFSISNLEQKLFMSWNSKSSLRAFEEQ